MILKDHSPPSPNAKRSGMFDEFDYVIVGGGTAGCVLASRLSRAGHTVALLEAGPQNHNDMIMSPVAAPALHATPLEYQYLSTPQEHLNNRELPNYGGRLLSGSSAVNYGNWTRCHRADYDAWAALVGDQRWSYQGLLRYFKRVEDHHAPDADPEVHGFGGPIHTNALAREYPLRDPVRRALRESGLTEKRELNTGNPLGFAPFQENWSKEHKRQPAGLAYDLSLATIFTNTTVSKILIEPQTKTATGAVAIDGRTFHARKEVLLTAGSLRSPQILMLSGIGPANHLSEMGIEVLEDLPVGENLHDHLACNLFWKLKHPEQNLAAGAPGFSEKFNTGLPIEWIVTSSTPEAEAQAAAKLDGLGEDDPLLSQPRGNFEFFIAYAPLGAAPIFKDQMPAPGTHITTPVLGLLPTSRGTVKLADKNPETYPIIDPAYYSTEIDRAALRSGLRAALRTFQETSAAKEFLEGETPPPGMKALTSTSSDEELDERIRAIGSSFYQCAGTCAMGKVVDGECKVIGIKGLRVVDASVFPLPLAGHYQAPVYALAESMADLILGRA